MKKWRRRGGIGLAPPGLSGCTLTDLGGGIFEVTWSWSGADPDEFRLAFSIDHGVNFEFAIGSPVAGNARSFLFDTAGLEGEDVIIRIEARVGGVTTGTCFTNEVLVPA